MVSSVSLPTPGNSLPKASCDEEALKRSHLGLALCLNLQINPLSDHLCLDQLYLYAKQGFLSVCTRQVSLCALVITPLSKRIVLDYCYGVST